MLVRSQNSARRSRPVVRVSHVAANPTEAQRRAQSTHRAHADCRLMTRAWVLTDKQVREKAVTALSQYLRRAREIDDLGLRKIWKALFYCFWHSDKPKVQAELAERLSVLVHTMAEGRAWPFAIAFWTTMTREWRGIDRLRLDKFYMLMRRSLEQQLRLAAAGGWTADGVQELATMLGGVGGPAHPASPVGVRYFLCDSFLDALRFATRLGGSGAPSGETLMVMLEPFMRMLGAAEDDVMMRRLIEGVLQTILTGDTDSDDDGGDDDGDDDDGGSEGDAAARKQEPPMPRPLAALAERLFTLASDAKTRERNRRLLYALQQRVEAAANAQAAAEAEAASARQTALPAKKRRRTKASGAAEEVVSSSASGAAASKEGRSTASGQAKAGAAASALVPKTSELSALRKMLGKQPRPASSTAPTEQPMPVDSARAEGRRGAKPGKEQGKEAKPGKEGKPGKEAKPGKKRMRALESAE